jgi:hypothetical protein
MPKVEAAKTFGVGISSVKRYVAAARAGRSLAPKKRPGSKPKMNETARRLLETDLEERPAATLPERREFLRRMAGVRVSDSTVSRACSEAWGGAEKRWVGASERDEFLRAAWRATVARRTKASRFVFVDECSTNTSLRRLYAWSRRGERALCSSPRNWGPNVTSCWPAGRSGAWDHRSQWRGRPRGRSSKRMSRRHSPRVCGSGRSW